MPVGLLTLELHRGGAIAEGQAQVLRSLKDRLRAAFNVAVAELDFEDTWQRSVVGVVDVVRMKSIMWKRPCRRFWRRPTGSWGPWW